MDKFYDLRVIFGYNPQIVESLFCMYYIEYYSSDEIYLIFYPVNNECPSIVTLS